MTNDPVYVRAHDLVLACEAAGARLAWNDAKGALEVAGAQNLHEELRSTLRVHAGQDIDEAARAGLESRRALRMVLAAQGYTARALLCFPVAALAGLPLPFTLTCSRAGAPWLVTTWKADYQSALARGVPGFVLRELEAAALAAEYDRAGPHSLDQWLANKKRGQWVLTLELSGALDLRISSREARTTWSLGRVLDGLGASLVSVLTHEVQQQKQGAA